MDNFSFTPESLYSLLITFGQKLIVAIIILLVGLWITSVLTKAFSKFLDKRDVDASLKPFLRGLFNALLKVAVFLSVLGTLGIEMTSFIAILGAAGLAVGMALSGTLQNFAGGVMILILKPFKIGDFIDAQGHTGTVNEISIFHTIMKTPDNKTIIIPNGPLSNGSLTNYSTEPKRRVDWTFGIGYGDDVDKARDVMMKIIKEDSRIDSDPAPFVKVSALADSSVNFAVRVWLNAADYWDVYFDMNERIYKEFPKANLNIPFPQMDVHLIKE